MPARVITLPVKCSTVKKIDSALWYIASVELVALWISASGAFITYHLMVNWQSPSEASALLNYFITFSIMVAGFIVVVVHATDFILNGAVCILDKIPRMECIRDEPEEPRFP